MPEFDVVLKQLGLNREDDVQDAAQEGAAAAIAPGGSSGVNGTNAGFH